jgi:hypothetical protein
MGVQASRREKTDNWQAIEWIGFTQLNNGESEDMIFGGGYTRLRP